MRTVVLFTALALCACTSRAHTLTNGEKSEAAKKGFAAADLNHDGVISREEWSALETKAAAPIPEASRKQYLAALEDNFRRMDKNKDGKITFAEYTADNFGENSVP